MTELSNSDWTYECECGFQTGDLDELMRHIGDAHLLPKIRRGELKILNE